MLNELGVPSLGVTPNQLQYCYDVHDNPLDVLLGRLALGPAEEEPS